MHSYVCPDLVKEFAKYDSNPQKYIRKYEGIKKGTGRTWVSEVGYERFLGPEIFFNPEIFSSDFLTPLPEVVDEAIYSPENAAAAMDKVDGRRKKKKKKKPIGTLPPETKTHKPRRRPKKS